MKRSKDRATRIIALFLMGMMCLGLAACGTVTETDSSAVDAAEVTEVEEETEEEHIKEPVLGSFFCTSSI